jgi:hypothetical protein
MLRSTYLRAATASRTASAGGVFALWSNAAPDDEFMAALGEVFSRSQSHVVCFPNPLQNREASNTVYVATTET